MALSLCRVRAGIPPYGFTGPGFAIGDDKGQVFDSIAGRQLVDPDPLGPDSLGPVNGISDPIVFAVGRRFLNNTAGDVLFFVLDPAAPLDSTTLRHVYSINVGCSDRTDPCAFRAEQLAVADFNDDGIPDFVASKHEKPVEIYVGSVVGGNLTYDPQDVVVLDSHTLPPGGSARDSLGVAANDAMVVVGAPAGAGRNDPSGSVFVYDVVTDPLTFALRPVILSLLPQSGDQFGFGVALRTDALIVVGAPGVDATKKKSDVGEVWLSSTGLSVQGPSKNANLGWRVAAAGNDVVAATLSDARIYYPLSFRKLEPTPGGGAGWASGGIATGDANGNGVPDIIIGAPDVPCGEIGHAGVAYLFDGEGSVDQVFVPQIAENTTEDDCWNLAGARPSFRRSCSSWNASTTAT